MIKIIVLKDDHAVSDFKQQKNDKEITIGRAPGCSVRLEEESVSRLHALLRHSGDSWIIDKKAANGKIEVNGEEVENAPLQGGEEIKIGSFILKIEIEEESGSSSAEKIDDSVENENEKTSFMSVSSAAGFFRFEPGAASVTEFAMTADLAVFGRASNCDVVLTEKRASRKHVEIRKQGLSFFLKDLNSANGTIINGNTLKEEVELVPGDIIEIGDCKIQFTVENKDFFSKQNDFLPVPTHLAEADQQLVEPIDANHQQTWNPNSTAGMDGAYQEPSSVDGFAVDPVASEPETKSIIKKLLNKYKSLTPIQRYIVIGIVAAMIFSFLGEPDDDTKKEVPKAPQIKRGADGKPLRIYENLTEEKKKFVTDAYKNLLTAMEKRDYPKMQENVAQITTYVDDYKDTKTYETLAKKGMEEQEQQERERKLNERKEKLRQEVAVLEEKGKELYTKALAEEKFREDLTKVVQEVFSKDPNSRIAQDWINGIKEKEAEEKREKEIARQKELLKQKAELAFTAVEKIFSDEKYIEALAAGDRLKDLGYSDKEYLERIDELKLKIRNKLAALIDPLLQEAALQRKDGGDLVKSKELYLQALKVDAQNAEAIAGLGEIREVLHIRAKRLYAEAILAESINDLSEAREKYEKCLKTAPEEDVYKLKCKNKLLKFESFNQELSQ